MKQDIYATSVRFVDHLFFVTFLITRKRQLLMGFESGLVVLWDLRTKVADARFLANEPLRSVSWLSDGKQLISAHTDGSLHTWNVRAGPRPAPVSVTYPHGTLFRIPCSRYKMATPFYCTFPVSWNSPSFFFKFFL